MHEKRVTNSHKSISTKKWCASLFSNKNNFPIADRIIRTLWVPEKDSLKHDVTRSYYVRAKLFRFEAQDFPRGNSADSNLDISDKNLQLVIRTKLDIGAKLFRPAENR